MKKLLLCILSLILCLNISIIHAEEPKSLMIVAHPDDEAIWGGSHLMNGNYTVLCITNGNNKKRKKTFVLHSSDHISWSYHVCRIIRRMSGSARICR